MRRRQSDHQDRRCLPEGAPRFYFVDHLSQGLGKIAASRYYQPVVVRMSDFMACGGWEGPPKRI
ncbi:MULTISPECIES: hypothetical protein [Desulfococcus]|uniref:hypothetical protein n=1 Tax=Desulfococcus TaxID=896 RepID=UPI0004209740|nr:hypothetical protein [Desulfococcus multivorans]AOY57649.1 uncharacterized protein Dmul_08740 [Desulfococcus multivorans]AQV00055.1 hypothetical protein B2D07_04210 [Desulfococcus multivorans]MDX9819210.1 hypothetical protein [Desulfococcus multivorans]